MGDVSRGRGGGGVGGGGGGKGSGSLQRNEHMTFLLDIIGM